MPGPPPEIRQIQGPEELRKVAPPADVRTPSKEPAKTAATPELAVVTVGVSNSTPKVGERVTINAPLRNSGTATIKGVKVRFFAGDRQVGERTIDLPPGRSDAGATFIPDSSGALQLKVTLDRDSATATRTLKVQGEGRVVAKAKTDPERPGSGESDKGAVPPQPVAPPPPRVTVPSPPPSGPRDGLPPPAPRVSAPPPATAARAVSAPASRATLAEARGKPPDDSGQATLPPQRIPFEKPEQIKNGTERPGWTGGPPGSRPGSPPGYGPPGRQDPTGGEADKHKPKGVPDTTPWGSGGMGKPDLGDGIEGVGEPGDMPKKDYGSGFPDWRQLPGQKTTG
ncbi:MAG TPA: CARDB domain-containing protein, partial [Desulfobaccales bacterium]